MKRILILSSLLLSFQLVAQDFACFKTLLDEGKAVLASGNKALALKKWRVALTCDDATYSDKQNLQKLINKAENSAVEETTSNDAFDMVFVQSGSFNMGSNTGEADEKPVHSVSLSDFYIGKYEITQKQWRAVMNTDPPELKFKGCDNCPVERVSWNDIQEFLTKLNQQFPGKHYRLPTEAEWEFAARGGNKSNDYTYSGSNSINDVAWYSSNCGAKTHEVGGLQANELSIYDMTGNVWEWCSDWYDENYYKNSPSQNPKGANSGTTRVLRGGSWYFSSYNCRVAYRGRGFPTGRDSDAGFRVARYN